MRRQKIYERMESKEKKRKEKKEKEKEAGVRSGQTLMNDEEAAQPSCKVVVEVEQARLHICYRFSGRTQFKHQLEFKAPVGVV